MNHLKIDCVSELVTSESLKLAIRSAGILQQKKLPPVIILQTSN
jgi:hypothetical protein